MSWWDPALLNLLSQHYTVTEFDLPGTGYSGPDATADSVDEVADLSAGLADTLGLDDPVVVGWGLGGEIALALVERHPGVAHGIVVIDSSAGGDGAVGPTSAVAAALASPNETNLELADLDFPSSATAAQSGFLARVGRLPADDLVASAIAEEASLQSSAFSDPTISRDLHAVSVPALVVVGSLDEVFPPENSSLLAGHLAHARELVLPGAGYASTSQDAAQFTLALTAFTADIPAG
jgi:3-oxoadipate enol-lactonase